LVPWGTKLRPSFVGCKAGRLGAAKERESQRWSPAFAGARAVLSEPAPLAGEELRAHDQQADRGGHHREHLKGVDDHWLPSLAGEVIRTLASMILISGSRRCCKSSHVV
jgi:hypothetical protein